MSNRPVKPSHLQRAISQVQRVLDSLEPKHEIVRAISGNGAGTVAVTGYTNFYWVRLHGDQSQLTQAFCDTMIPPNDAHVLVQVTDDPTHRYVIIGRPDTLGWFTGERDASHVGSLAPEHHVAHETGGDDMISVGTYMVENLRGGPTDPSSMKVRVSWAPNVTFGRISARFPDATSQYKDSAAITPPVWGVRFDLISVDSDFDINVTAGTPAWTNPTAPACPQGEIPVCYVLVRVADTTLEGNDFWPAASLWTTGITHAADHEDGGDDEIDVTDLSGLLADLQDAGWLQGNPVADDAPDDQDVLTWDAGAGEWIPQAGGAGGDHGHTAPGDGGVLAADVHSGYSDYQEAAKPAAPAANTARLYCKDDGSGVTKLYYQRSDGTEIEFEETDHHAKHEDGGDDEIDVGGLSGVLDDAQNADHLQGNDVDSEAPDDTDILAWSAASSHWHPVSKVSCQPPGKLILTAAGATPRDTSPCGDAAKLTLATNHLQFWALPFDKTSDEYCQWALPMPDWDGSTVTAKFHWTCRTGVGGAGATVCWSLKARAFADDDALDQALGAAATTTDTWIADNDEHISAATGACTVAGHPANGNLTLFEAMRDVSEDDLNGDAELLYVEVTYGRSGA